LVEAIQGRDAGRTRRLVEVWVHRRGLASLYDFCANTLPLSIDSDAQLWLDSLDLVRGSVVTEVFSPTSVVDQALAEYANHLAGTEPERVPTPQPERQAAPVSVQLPAVEEEATPARASSRSPTPDSLLRAAPGRAMRLVSRARVLLRECLEEVWDGLGGAASTRGRLEAVDPPSAAATALPKDVLPAAPATIPAPSASVALERLRPRPRLTVPRLPRATRPAPAPPDLADLRMWLPDPIEDLPRAC
jgi:hypothetical protein